MKTLLLHTCCCPCLLGCIDRVINDYKVTLYYYNPNIYPYEEHEKRYNELERTVKERYPNIDIIKAEYQVQDFMPCAKGHEEDKEGGIRCQGCIALRLSNTAKKAVELGFDAFDSTLAVSPHKDYKYILQAGKKISENTNVEFLGIDYKKKNGFLNSTKLSKEYGVYRQNYCGCEYSIWDK